MPEPPIKVPMDGSESPSARTVAWFCRWKRSTRLRRCRRKALQNVNTLSMNETTEELRRLHGDGSAGHVAMENQVKRAQGRRPDQQAQELRTL